MGWSNLVGAWVRTLVAEQRRSWRTTFAREIGQPALHFVQNFLFLCNACNALSGYKTVFEARGLG